MSEIRRFVIGGLEDAAGGAGGLRIGALDETGQEKAGAATAGVKRQYMGCAGRVANGINTVHLSYVRQYRGHALIGFRQWIPREQIEDPAVRQRMGLPAGLAFATKGELAVQILADAYADGLVTRLRVRGRGVWQLSRPALLPGRARPGVCAAGREDVPAHASAAAAG